MNQTYSVKEVADLLGYSTNSIYTFLKSKRIKGVRMGKAGKFRIPQSEVDRLLNKPIHLAPGSEKQQSDQCFTPPSSPTASQQAMSSLRVIHWKKQLDQGYSMSYVEWFVGCITIILGFALFLYQKGYQSMPENILIWHQVVRILLITSGIGYLISGVVMHTSIWRKIYQGAVLCSYGALGLVSMSIGDGNTVAITSIFFACALILFVIPAITSYQMFSLMAIVFGLIGGGILLWYPEYAPNIVPIFQGIDSTVLVIAWIVGTLIYVGLTYWSSSHRWIGAHMLMALYALVLCYLSMVHAANAIWSRAFVAVFSAVAVFIAPFWESFCFVQQKRTSIIAAFFTSLVVIHLTVMVGIVVFESIMTGYTSQQLGTRVSAGKTYVDLLMNSSKQVLENNQLTPRILQALTTKRDGLPALTKELFEQNRQFRRVLVFGNDGYVRAAYPPDPEVMGKSFAFREYFQEVMKTGRTAVSDVIDTVQTDKQSAVVIASPIADPVSASVSAILVGSLDLNSLNVKLQQIASSKTGEFFIVIDKNGRRIMHPKERFVDTVVDSADLLTIQRIARQNPYGFTEWNDMGGIRIFASYGVMESFDWIIIAGQEKYEAFTSSILGYTSIFVIFIGCIGAFVIVKWYCALKHHNAIGKEGS